MGGEQESVWDKTKHAGKNETQKCGVTWKLFLKTQAEVGYSGYTGLLCPFFPSLFCNFEETVRSP